MKGKAGTSFFKGLSVCVRERERQKESVYNKLFFYLSFFFAINKSFGWYAFSERELLVSGCVVQEIIRIKCSLFVLKC